MTDFTVTDLPDVTVEELLLVAVRNAIRALPGFYGCEIAETPAAPEGQDSPGMPYAILYPLPWDYAGPPMSPHSDAPVAFQVTTVGATGQQALFNSGRVRKLLVAMHPSTGDYLTPITVAGISIAGRSCTTAGGDEGSPGVHGAVDRFVFWVTPTT
jgi:hypothetical protein